jgi:hypothetical protein
VHAVPGHCQRRRGRTDSARRTRKFEGITSCVKNNRDSLGRRPHGDVPVPLQIGATEPVRERYVATALLQRTPAGQCRRGSRPREHIDGVVRLDGRCEHTQAQTGEETSHGCELVRGIIGLRDFIYAGAGTEYNHGRLRTPKGCSLRTAETAVNSIALERVGQNDLQKV